MMTIDVPWVDATSRALRHLAAVAVEHGWRVQWCRRHDDDGQEINEALRLELRREHRATTVVRIEACEVWADGSHGLMPWSEHTAGRPGLVRHCDGDADLIVARLRALGEASS